MPTFTCTFDYPEGSKVLSVAPRRLPRSDVYHWQVVLSDPLGAGHESLVAATAPTIEEAALQCYAPMERAIGDRMARQAERRRELFERSLQARALRPEGVAPPGPRPSPAASPGSFARIAGRVAARAPGAVTGWTDSVPYNAAQWHVDGRRVRVVLHPGLEFPSGGVDRTFETVRMAKDETRAAVPSRAKVEAPEHVIAEPDPKFREDLFG